MKKLFFALSLTTAIGLFTYEPEQAFGQCSGVFQSNTYCGRGATSGTPTQQQAVNSNVSPHQFGTISCNGTSDDTAAIQAAVNAAGHNGTVEFRAKCTYKITSTINVPFNFHYWIGAGDRSTTINYTPTANGTAINWGIGSTLTFFGGIKYMGVYCTETSFTKVVLKITDLDRFTVENFGIQGAGVGVNGTASCAGASGNSIGIQTLGRDFLNFFDTFVSADKPFVISKNPNNIIDFDHSKLSVALVAFNNPNLLIEDGVFVTNSTISGSFAGGTEGIKWISTNTLGASYAVLIDSLRIEQGQSTAAFSIDLDPFLSLQGLGINNVYLDGVRKGIRLRHISFGSIKDTNFPTNLLGLDINNTVNNLTLQDNQWIAGSTSSITGLFKHYATPTIPVGGSVPGSALFSTTAPDFNADVLSTGTNGGERGTLIMRGSTSGATSIKAPITAGNVQIDLPQLAGTIVTNVTAPLGIDLTNGTVSMTGLSALSQGDLIYGTSANTFARLTKDTNATRYLSNQGSSNNPSWNQVNLANGVTGTLPVANGGTGDTGTAWSTFTPSASCGSGTFTVNSAKSKAIGKTLHVQLDLTIATLGTCTNLITFNLPATANSGAGLAGRETVSGKGANCHMLSAGTTAACAKTDVTNFAASDRIVVSGVYESQ